MGQSKIVYMMVEQEILCEDFMTKNGEMVSIKIKTAS